METRELRSGTVRTFVLIRSKIPDRRIDSCSIVEALNVFENALFCFLMRFEFFQIDKFFLQHALKGFNTCMIVAVSFPAHAAFHPIGFQAILILVRSILATTIRMVQYLVLWTLMAKRLIQYFQD